MLSEKKVEKLFLQYALFCKEIGREESVLIFQKKTIEPTFVNMITYRGKNKQSGRDGNADKTSVNASFHIVSTLGSIFYIV